MRYHNITKDDMLNGDGLRVVLWVAGCEHACKECHNPTTWDAQGGVLFDDKAKAELFEALSKDYISGITFSGGDPLHPANRVSVKQLAKEIRESFPNKTIWLYTGSVWEDFCENAVVQDLDVLVDGEFVVGLKDTKLLWKGSSNQRVIDVQETLKQADKSIPVLHCKNYKSEL
ncbi:MAG: anaerobic ribonucleoside-triphosphate reductase activating protein [Lachnospiraceae bacterium]